MHSHMVSLDHWRNFQPVAPDYDIVVKAGSPYVLDLSDIIIQGAREFDTHDSPSPGILDKIPVQRGWRLTPIIMEKPQLGFIELVGNTIVYHPQPNHPEGTLDCFNYVLTNGTQKSKYGRVNIEFGAFYSINITGNKFIDGTFSFHGELVVPDSLPTPQFIFMLWEEHYKKSVYNAELDRMEVVDATRVIHQTAYHTYTYWTTGYVKRYRFVILDPGQDVSRRVIQDDLNVSGFLPGTTLPYRPTGDKSRITLTIRLYDISTYTGLIWKETLSTDLTPFFGERWWESGNLAQV